MDWLFSLVRIAGVAFPGASSLVQLQAEIDSTALSERIKNLEDPISHLHEEIPNVARLIYKELKVQNSGTLSFDPEFYLQYRRPLAMLESQRYLSGEHAIGNMYAAGITLSDPSFILYLCALGESDKQMNSLASIVDSCEPGKWLSGDQLSIDLDLPKPVVRAVFIIYQSKGLGQLSQEIGALNYVGRA